ncbi:hypothetical protein FOL47_006509 [Perkinsus chesapeaki]|uniref:Uncharacterized protein n=1 Tax=Perkinsus chesapeaki TaxID=330153 RepID=A0A7J6LRL2_PERCH|nr:hypothetical protein FOL47_006509 [Perkinsus chesapeaki]
MAEPHPGKSANAAADGEGKPSGPLLGSLETFLGSDAERYHPLHHEPCRRFDGSEQDFATMARDMEVKVTVRKPFVVTRALRKRKVKQPEHGKPQSARPTFAVPVVSERENEEVRSSRSDYHAGLIEGMTVKPDPRKTPLLAALYARVKPSNDNDCETATHTPPEPEMTGAFSVTYATLLKISKNIDLSPSSHVKLSDFAPLFYWFRIGRSMSATLTVLRIALDQDIHGSGCSMKDLRTATYERESEVDEAYADELVHVFRRIRRRFGGPSESHTADWLSSYERVWQDMQMLFNSDDCRLVRARRAPLLQLIARMKAVGLAANPRVVAKLLSATQQERSQGRRTQDIEVPKEHTVSFDDFRRVLCRSALTYTCIKLMKLVVQRLPKASVGSAASTSMKDVLSLISLMQRDDALRAAARMIWQEEEVQLMLGLVVAAAQSNNEVPSRRRGRTQASSRRGAGRKDALQILEVLAERVKLEQSLMDTTTDHKSGSEAKKEGRVKFGTFARVLLANGLLPPDKKG